MPPRWFCAFSFTETKPLYKFFPAPNAMLGSMRYDRKAVNENRSHGIGGVHGAHGIKGDYGGITDHTGRGPKSYTRPDERIEDDVYVALTRDPYIDASDIEIEVKKGVVHLRGSVEDRFSKKHAEDVIEDLLGVKDVYNELSIGKGLT